MNLSLFVVCLKAKFALLLIDGKGGRHELYGVVLNDYKAFANSIATALRKIMGEENVSVYLIYFV